MSEGPEYQLSRVRVEFDADAYDNGAWTPQRIRLDWDVLNRGTAENELLMQLWRLWYAQTLARLQANGSGPLELT